MRKRERQTVRQTVRKGACERKAEIGLNEGKF